MATKKLNIDILARDKSRQALNQVQGNLEKTKKSVLNVKNALIGLGVGLAVRSIVNVGREVENLQVRFKFLFGSVEEGKLAFDNLSKFASKVPFSLEEITAASGNLAVVAKDANDLNRILEITGNVAAVTGLDFATAGSQIQRAFSGGIAAADIFREKGVRQLLGFKEGAKVSIDETVAAFEEAFSGDGRFANATDDLANTLTGTASMLQDKLFNFQKNISGQFIGTLTDELGDLNKFLEDNQSTINEIAELLGTTLANSIILLGKSITTTKASIDKFDIGVRDLVLDLIPLGFGLGSIREEFPELADAIDDFLTKNFPQEIHEIGENINQLAKSMEQNAKAMFSISEITDNSTNSIEKNSEAISKNMELAKGMETFQIRNNEIMKTINHAEIERQKKLDEAVERSFKRQEAANKKRVELEKQAQSQIVDATGDALQKISGLNKTAFRAYQAFQIAQATINTFRAVSNALATFPPPINAFVAGAELARGLATVAQIRSVAPPRIAGGRVNKDQPVMVGEAGREMFVPQQSGTIVPNNQLTGTNVNITIMANDTEGFDDLLSKRRATVVNIINDALNSQGKEAII